MIVFALSLGILGAFFEDGRDPKGYTLKTWMTLWRSGDKKKTNV